MIKVNQPWTPLGFHGELSFPNSSDPQTIINQAIKKLPIPGFSDIKYCVITRHDGGRALFFELI